MTTETIKRIIHELNKNIHNFAINVWIRLNTAFKKERTGIYSRLKTIDRTFEFPEESLSKGFKRRVIRRSAFKRSEIQRLKK
jgi:hypothetical protein